MIAKAGRLEVRQLRASSSSSGGDAAGGAPSTDNSSVADLANPFPLLFQVPVYGRITHMVPFSLFHSPTSLVFFLTDQHQYGVLGASPNNNENNNTTAGGSIYPIVTHASGSVTADSFWTQGAGGLAGAASAGSGAAGAVSGAAGAASGGGGAGGSASGGGGASGGPSSSSSSSWVNDNALAVLGREAEAGPSVLVDPLGRCIVMHLHTGLLAVLPIHRNYNPLRGAQQQHDAKSYKTDSSTVVRHSSSTSSLPRSCLGPLFHCRMEERTILAMEFLQFPTNGGANILPHVCLLHQDARGVQHVTTHVLNLQKRQLYLLQTTALAHEGAVEWLRKTAVDGGSAMLLSVPPPPSPAAAAAAAASSTSAVPPATGTSSNGMTTTNNTTASTQLPTSGGVIVIGQRQFTYCSSTTTKIIPVPQALYLSSTDLPADPNNGMPRYLLSDEFGNLHMLTLLLTNTTNNASSLVLGLQLETLGSCNLCRDLCYLGHGLVYAGSHLGDSQLIQIHDEPIPVHESVLATTTASGRRGTQAAAAAAMEEDGGGDAASAAALNAAAALDTDMNVLLADTTYIQVLEEYTNLGPILDFDLVPTAPPTTNASTTTASPTAAAAAATTPLGDAASQTPSSIMSRAAAAPSSTPTTIQQSQVVTCSGTSKMGSLRLIRNGIGMNEYASVEIPGISNMWSLRQVYQDEKDTYLVQSFVGQTRVLGVTLSTAEGEEDEDGDKTMTNAEGRGRKDGGEDEEEEEQFGSLEEVVLPGLESDASTLYVGNLPEDQILQITETEIRLIGPFDQGGQVLDTWSNGHITVAAANETGQIALAQHGGNLLYFQVEGSTIRKVAEREMEREVSCLNLNPFYKTQGSTTDTPMDVDGMDTTTTKVDSKRPSPVSSRWLAVGLWDDFTVRLLDLKNDALDEAQKIFLSSQPEAEDDTDESELLPGAPGRRNRNNMMARSLCLITLDFSSSNSNNPGGANQKATTTASSPGVDMLFVGLGDGSLISFAVLMDRRGQVSVRSKKEVCLGTQRIDLVPLSTRGGGSCVLATGDRPTVIYLAGIGGGHSSSAHFNPKLCYSSVNLSASEDDEIDESVSRPPAHQSIAVNVASPFYSPLLFDSVGATGSATTTSHHYSLCIADETSLRLGVIDDIQKLHVTTCRLGMAPRRIVHCVDGRLFAVGCIESGIKHLGTAEALSSMGNCIRFMDDTNFDDIKRVDLDPFETILSMAYVTMTTPDREAAGADSLENQAASLYKPFLVIGTGYSFADESEITRGRILLFSCEADENSAGGGNRTVRQVTELSTNGGVFSVCQFYNGTILCAVNSKTMICRLHDDAGLTNLQFVGVGHHGHILSMFLKSGARPPQLTSTGETTSTTNTSIDGNKTRNEASSKKEKKAAPAEMLAIVGDLMRSVSVVQYFPEHEILEEIARDYTANWTTAVEMINDDIYLAAEHWCNLYCLRRNKHASSEEIRGRLDIVGEYHLAEMCNKFMRGSLVMPVSVNSGGSMGSSRRQQKARRVGNAESPVKSPSKAARAVRRPVVVTGSQTLYGTVDGSIGVVLGLDGRTAAFFSTLERSMAKVIRPIGDLSHQHFRAFHGERRKHPAHGFVDGDLIESFLDLDRNTMEAVVYEMNRDGGWEVDESMLIAGNTTMRSSSADTEGEEDISPELLVDDVVAMVEEISMLH